MGWVTRKLDNLGSATSGGVGGIGLSQAPAFTQAYLQRLGGHIDEARRTVARIEHGEMLPWLSASDRAEAVAELSLRVAELEASQRAILDAHPLLQPLIMLRRVDMDIATRAFESFTPALPLDTVSLIYIGLGVVLALIVYELIKSPAELLQRRRARRQRRFTGSGSGGGP